LDRRLGGAQSHFGCGGEEKNFQSPYYMRAICKVCGLTLLFQVGTLWRCGDGLFFEVSLLASDALFTTLHPLLKNMLQTVDHFKISFLGALFSWLEKPRNCILGGGGSKT
jgi:hypothetical protein